MLLSVSTALIDRFFNRDERALARAISLVESGLRQGQQLLQTMRPHGGKAVIIGITGSPGSGKSTLTDRLIAVARERDKRVAVIAVDPTSPYSGGAILGDRIRMMRWHQDENVYIRSMATRGHLGGLAAATLQVVALLDAYGFDLIFIETVGVGQSEVDIVEVADSTVLVLTPGQGDGVQAFKAGIMEIADIFAINKFDLPGGPRLKREIQAVLELNQWTPGSWQPPISETIASQGQGISELYEHIEAHYRHLQSSGKLRQVKQQRARFEIAALITEEVRRKVHAREQGFIEAVLHGQMSLEEAVKELLRES